MKFFLLLLIFFSQSIFAQTNYTIYVPYAPGGWSDRIGRIISVYEKNTNVINITAGKTPKGIETTHKNGQIFIAGLDWIVVNPLLYGPEFNYDVRKNFEVFVIGNSPYVFLTNQSLSSNNIKEFINQIKTNNIDLRYSISSAATHIASIEFLSKLNINGRPIPYKNGASQSIFAVMNNDFRYCKWLYFLFSHFINF